MSVSPSDVTSWLLCLGCGAWQRRGGPCQVCGSQRLVTASMTGAIEGRTGQQVDGGAVRVLVEFEARSDGTVRATKLHTHRLPSIRHDVALLERLDRAASEALSRGKLDDATWADLRVTSMAHVTEAIDGVLRPRWPGKSQRSSVPLELSFRALLLDPQRTLRSTNLPWLEVVPVFHALERAGKTVRDEDLRHSLHESRLSLDEGGERLRLSLIPSIEIMTKWVSLWSTGEAPQELARFDGTVTLPRNQQTRVLDVRLGAEHLRQLAPEGGGSSPGAELRVTIHGREDRPYRVAVPCGDLGDQRTLVDVFLDLGSTTTKYAVQVGTSLTTPRHAKTEMLAREWSLPLYEKSRMLADPTGRVWAEWVPALLGALRRYAARVHRGYLQRVHLTLPDSGSLAVKPLAAAVQRTDQALEREGALDMSAVQSLQRRIEIEAAGARGVVLEPEHTALARHYLAPLRALRLAASSYQRAFKEHETLQETQRAEQRDWDVRRARQREFDQSNFFVRMFKTRPPRPSGGRPTVSSSMMSPTEWMRRLIDRPDLLDRVILLDAGGLSLDVAVLESAVCVAELSKSDATCGGEEVTRRLASHLGRESLPSDDGTRLKARLGAQWANKANTADLPDDERFGRFGGRDQRAYHQATHQVYEALVRALAQACAARWKPKRAVACTVLLTGGGSANPHFVKLVADCLAEAGLEADVMHAPFLQESIESARRYQHPSLSLTSPGVTLFTTVYDWSYDLEKNAGSKQHAYDKFAVVGGLIAGVKT